MSPKTGYKWVERYRQEGAAGLVERSRRPHSSPGQTTPEVAALVVALRAEQPAWGGRKLHRRLRDLHVETVPAASTCTAILRRAGAFEAQAVAPGPWQRFVRAQPNELWQMDFKGHYATQTDGRCHPFTVLDDHSRFNLALVSCVDQTGATVKGALGAAFTVWLLRLGVRVLHGRAYHPQTQGKEERFHRTLHAELLGRHTWRDLAHCAECFARYREVYNCERPHEALGGDTPVRHYQPSPRAWPSSLPPIEYEQQCEVRRVCAKGTFGFGRRRWYAGRAFAGQPLGRRPSAPAEGLWEVRFGQHVLGSVSLRSARHHDASSRPLSIYQPPA